jgi:UDP-glucose 4-epimerase
MSKKHMKILVTGGTGYIGSHTIVELINDGHEVVVVDNLSNSKADVIRAIEEITSVKPEFIKADLRDKNVIGSVFERHDFDAVVHFAGFKAVGESVKKPLKYYDNNVNSTLVLLSAMLEHSVNNLIFSSSAVVYGEPGVVEYSEYLPTGQNISSPYGKTKYMIEEIIKDVVVTNPEFEAVVLRYFNPIGAHESGLIGESPRGVPNNLLPFVAQVATREQQKLQVFGGDYETPDGTCIRDYVHVVDVAKGHLVALNEAKKGVAIYNLGSGHGASVLEVVKAFENASGETIPFEITSRRPGDLPEYFANVNKISRKLGWHAEKSLEEACRDSWNFQQKQTR